MLRNKYSRHGAERQDVPQKSRLVILVNLISKISRLKCG